jgi:hypothetical protein
VRSVILRSPRLPELRSQGDIASLGLAKVPGYWSYGSSRMDLVARLPNEGTSPFKASTSLSFLRFYHEMVKDLGLEFGRMTRGLEEVSSSDG